MIWEKKNKPTSPSTQLHAASGLPNKTARLGDGRRKLELWEAEEPGSFDVFHAEVFNFFLNVLTKLTQVWTF